MNSSQVKLKLDYCSHEAARFAVEKWHYSKTMPNGKIVKIGIWEDDKFIGCVLFGNGANNHIGCPYGLKQTECIELLRIAIKKHVSQVSKIIKVAIRLLLKISPNLKLIVSYADTKQGHVGSIYQASNFIYVGESIAQSVLFNGKKTHGKSLSDRFGFGGIDKLKQIDPKAKIIHELPKHKYLYPLTEDIKELCKKLSKPYPKRIADDSNSVQQDVAV